MTQFFVGVVLGAAAVLAWINRAWIADKFSGWKWIDK